MLPSLGGGRWRKVSERLGTEAQVGGYPGEEPSSGIAEVQNPLVRMGLACSRNAQRPLCLEHSEGGAATAQACLIAGNTQAFGASSTLLLKGQKSLVTLTRDRREGQGRNCYCYASLNDRVSCEKCIIRRFRQCANVQSQT